MKTDDSDDTFYREDCIALGERTLRRIPLAAVREIRVLRSLLRDALPYIEETNYPNSPSGFADRLARRIKSAMMVAPPGPPNFWNHTIYELKPWGGE